MMNASTEDGSLVLEVVFGNASGESGMSEPESGATSSMTNEICTEEYT